MQKWKIITLNLLFFFKCSLLLCTGTVLILLKVQLNLQTLNLLSMIPLQPATAISAIGYVHCWTTLTILQGCRAYDNCVCLSVCSHLCNHMSKHHQICCVCSLWPWLSQRLFSGGNAIWLVLDDVSSITPTPCIVRVNTLYVHWIKPNYSTVSSILLIILMYCALCWKAFSDWEPGRR